MNASSRVRRDGMLREMGLAPLWRLRSVATAAPEVRDEVVDKAAPVEPEAWPAQAGVSAAMATALPRGDLPRERPGLPRRPAVVPPAADPASRPAEPAAPAGGVIADAVGGLGWDELEARIRECAACGLCKRRKQAVPGVGDREADWLFVGEGPGAEEDERGEPFVGQAGRLLDNMLASIGLARGQDVYIGNAVKCRPPNNRTPETPELAACFPYLQRQIELIRPRLIVALGRPAAQALLNQEIKIGAARGKLFSYQGIPVVVTYHPAYLLRNLADKAKTWEDLCFARANMARLKAGT